MTSKEAINYILTNGGMTMSLLSKNIVTYETGYQVSIRDILKVHRDVFINPDFFRVIGVALGIATFEDRNKDEAHIGFWLDEDGWVCIDVSTHVSDLSNALYMGEEFKQKAIYDWANKASIYVKKEVE